jgi:hypothetical protein
VQGAGSWLHRLPGPFPHPAQISASSITNPGKSGVPSRRLASSFLVGATGGSPSGPHNSTARSAGMSSQPARPGAVALIGGHLPAQGRQASGALIAGARQLHHQIRTQRSEATALFGAEGLPAIEGHQGGIEAEDGTNSFGEALRLRASGSRWSWTAFEFGGRLPGRNSKQQRTARGNRGRCWPGCAPPRCLARTGAGLRWPCRWLFRIGSLWRKTSPHPLPTQSMAYA